MHARSSTFKGGPDAVDGAVSLVRDHFMPAVLDLDGCVGLSLLVDRESGTCIVTTAWESRQALSASGPRVAPWRDRAQELFGGRPDVQTWEIGVLHRAHQTGPDACARVTWTRMRRDQIDLQLAAFRREILPQVQELPGFASASLLVDRLTGRSALAVVYDSRGSLAESREAAMGVRTDAVARLSSELLDVAEFEVAVAHLRVPETV